MTQVVHAEVDSRGHAYLSITCTLVSEKAIRGHDHDGSLEALVYMYMYDEREQL